MTMQKNRGKRTEKYQGAVLEGSATSLPSHDTLHDATGASLVVEPVDGTPPLKPNLEPPALDFPKQGNEKGVHRPPF